MDAAALSRDLIIPTFVVVTYVGENTGGEAYTISNEVSGTANFIGYGVGFTA